MNLNSTPPEGLCARESAFEAEEAPRGVGVANAPQTGTQGPGPRALILDAIARVVREGRYWLPVDGQRAIADAVLALRDQEVEQLRTRAELAHKARRTTTDYLDEIRVHLTRHGVDVEHLRHDGDVPLRLRELLAALDEQPPTA